jgi:hypothetical protein
VGARLEENPGLLALARARVETWTKSGGTHPYYAQAWKQILERPLPEILAVLADRSEFARDLRQASPFAGFLDPKTRFRIHRDVLERWNRR